MVDKRDDASYWLEFQVPGFTLHTTRFTLNLEPAFVIATVWQALNVEPEPLYTDLLRDHLWEQPVLLLACYQLFKV